MTFTSQLRAGKGVMRIVETRRQRYLGTGGSTYKGRCSRVHAVASAATGAAGAGAGFHGGKQQPQAVCHQAQDLLHLAVATTAVGKSCNMPLSAPGSNRAGAPGERPGLSVTGDSQSQYRIARLVGHQGMNSWSITAISCSKALSEVAFTAAGPCS
jgi:hypothetical protein